MVSHSGLSRRPLAFRSLAEVLPDVRRLLRSHRTVGRWTLAQICRHLADTLHGSIDGMDLSNHRWKRRLLGQPLLWVTFVVGIPRNYLVDPRLTPPADTCIEQAVPMLERAIGRYQGHADALRAHPLFGRMTRRQWDRMHCLHCAHHLSFALPM